MGFDDGYLVLDLRNRITAPLHAEYRHKATVFPFFTTHEKHVLAYEVVR